MPILTYPNLSYPILSYPIQHAHSGYKYLYQGPRATKMFKRVARAAVVHVNFRAGSIFPVPVWSVPRSMDRASRCNKVDAVRLYASYRSNLPLLKRQRCVVGKIKVAPHIAGPVLIVGAHCCVYVSVYTSIQLSSCIWLNVFCIIHRM